MPLRQGRTFLSCWVKLANEVEITAFGDEVVLTKEVYTRIILKLQSNIYLWLFVKLIITRQIYIIVENHRIVRI